MTEKPILFSGPMVRAILDGSKTMTRRAVKNLRVRLRHPIPNDMPEVMPDPPRTEAGDVYPAELNRNGAVSARIGETLFGVKPGEFDFVCPYAEGVTGLLDVGEGKQWTIQAKASSLWVRETWGADRTAGIEGTGITYRADNMRRFFSNQRVELTRPVQGPGRGNDEDGIWRPSIFMPRWASRIGLNVSSIGIERLQSISDADVLAEGVTREAVAALTGKSWALDTSLHDLWRLGWSAINGVESWEANPWVWVVRFQKAEA